MNKKQSILLITPIALIIIVPIALGTIFFSQPSEGVLLTSDSPDIRKPAESATTVSSPTEITTDCFDISLNATIDSIKQEKTQNGCVLRARSTQPLAEITVSSEKIHSGKEFIFLEYPSIALRESKPELYVPLEKNTFSNDLSGLTSNSIATKVYTTATEITGFFYDHNEQTLVIISLHNAARISASAEVQFWNLVASVRL